MTELRRIVAVLACHSRCATTLQGLGALKAQDLPPNLQVETVLVDDGSTDGTVDAVRSAFTEVRVLCADGSLWWAGAMALGVNEAVGMQPEFVLWLNDDVVLDRDALERLVVAADAVFKREGQAGIIVGATRQSRFGVTSYGGQRRVGRHPLKTVLIEPDGTLQACDTFQGNVVLVPTQVLLALGGIPEILKGVQGMADTEFGLRARAAGVPVILTPSIVGTCSLNTSVLEWRRPELTLWQRFRSVFGPKGFPIGSTIWFMRRYGGWLWWYWLLSVWGHAFLQSLWPARQRASPWRLAMMVGVVAPYRARQIAGLSATEDLQATVYFGPGLKQGWLAESVAASAISLPTSVGRNWFWPAGRGRRIWTSGTLGAVLGGSEAVLLSFHVHDLSVWFAVLMRRITGWPKVLLYGHFGLDRTTASGLRAVFQSFRRRLRILLAKNGDAILPYTSSGSEACLRAGIDRDRIFVTHNSVDIESIRRACGQVDDGTLQTVRDRIGLPAKPMFLIVSRLYPAKRVDLAIDAINELGRRGHDCTLAIVGDGPSKAGLVNQALNDPRVRFLDATSDETALAPLFKLSTALLLPGAAGLAVVHAFGYGVPVILCPADTHGPEADYMVDGKNGLMSDAQDSSSLADKMTQLLEDSDLQRHLRQGASKTADGLGVQHGVQAIIDAVMFVRDKASAVYPKTTTPSK